jgi:hypothetical protein
MEITLIRHGVAVTYRLAVVRCDCGSTVVVASPSFPVRECGGCGQVPE